MRKMLDQNPWPEQEEEQRQDYPDLFQKAARHGLENDPVYVELFKIHGAQSHGRGQADIGYFFGVLTE